MFACINDTNLNCALIDNNVPYSYADLNKKINCFSSGLLTRRGLLDLNEERIAFFIPASLDYVTTMHGIWRAGGIALPLNVASAVGELSHYLSDANVSRLIASGKYQYLIRDLCNSMNIEILSVNDVLMDVLQTLPVVEVNRRALILYTSGTTNKPKGVVTTHHNIRTQVMSLIEGWAWSNSDKIPLFLPVHHIHGIINILSCCLWSGATVHLFSKFDISAILTDVAEGKYTLFMAVPTVYVKIIHHLEALSTSNPHAKRAICDGFKAMRLNVSGSAACPVKLFNQWYDLTSQILLERYGMTEIGMGLSNPYAGERRAGCVGMSLPYVQVALFDETDHMIDTSGSNNATENLVAGEIRVRGDNVFLEYWNNPEATSASFKDGWFCTGDVAVVEQGGYFRILGRSSIDIIKSGGYKLSALEIEGCLLNHPSIADCAVIGVEDETWGEVVVAFVVIKHDMIALDYSDLKVWCADKMSSYKIPKRLITLESFPRNAMGKVVKSTLKALL